MINGEREAFTCLKEEEGGRMAGEWRYNGEVLGNVHVLRLHLFHPSISPLRHCLCLRASFSTHPSLSLRCSWTTPTTASSCLIIPLPLLLYDHSAPIHSSLFHDHLQFRVQLLHVAFPLHHHPDYDHAPASLTYGLDLKSRVSSCKEVALRNPDASALKSQGDVYLYCKHCSTKISREPIRDFLQSPSVNWPEIAEHWFGTCCSSGAKSGILMAKFEKTFGTKQGTCFVSSASCYINIKDVIMNSILEAAFLNLHVSSDNKKQKFVQTSVEAPTLLVGSKDDDAPKLGVHSCNSCCHGDLLWKQDTLSGILNLNKEETDLINDGYSCETSFYALPERFPNIVPVNCFLTQESGMGTKIKWVPVHCSGCGSLLGSCVLKKETSDSDIEGVHFLKCQISTNNMVGSSFDIFRFCTFESTFALELHAIMEENASYRYAVRGLNSKNLLLQLVILNYDCLIFTGTCLEKIEANEQSNNLRCTSILNSSKGLFEPLSENAAVQTVAKVLFVDCNGFTETEMRDVENWVAQNDVEDIYIMEEVVDSLRDALVAHALFFPNFSNSFQNFRLSYIER